jgi:hypothetical protein
MSQGEAYCAVGLRGGGTGGGNAIMGGNDFPSHLRGLETTVGVVAEARGRAIWERSVYVVTESQDLITRERAAQPTVPAQDQRWG